ncbi:hypothetical protein BDV95DRAFT_165705 [Massariosphaeria phaeospora]|uniref:Myb-like domain-containing protein n=1 Tax=Massariosphaeria phaeospora TaxID=100035 RepID=A0A7C8M7F8_9PLEO|nr:hypothetical protein BDV95DRAFT_165705 [Massariosphaeria phaeospora]
MADIVDQYCHFSCFSDSPALIQHPAGSCRSSFGPTFTHTDTGKPLTQVTAQPFLAMSTMQRTHSTTPLQHQFKFESGMTSQYLPDERYMSRYRQLCPKPESTSEPAGFYNNTWEQMSTSGCASTLNSRNVQPAIMTNSRPLFATGGHSGFDNSLLRQNTLGNSAFEHGAGGPCWLYDSTGLPHTGQFSGSDLETNASNSPVSVFSEPSEQDLSHTPGTVVESNWDPFPTGHYQHLIQSPADTASSMPPTMDYKLCQPSQSAEGINTSEHEGFGLGISMPSAQQRPAGGQDMMTWSRAPFTQHSSMGMRQWQPNHATQLPSSIPYVQRLQRRDGMRPEDQNGTTPIYGAGARGDGTLQHTLQVMFTPDTQAQRQTDDGILLDGKAEGLTYKEIKKRMSTNVAESTLRGRYRSLTKPRKDRVRKPMWTGKDIQLLEEIVLAELDRLDDGARATTQNQKLAKLSWKRVGEYIAEHGGSYHFGNSTCKKKWTELHSGG